MTLKHNNEIIDVLDKLHDIRQQFNVASQAI